jgi:hypothetical protein
MGIKREIQWLMIFQNKRRVLWGTQHKELKKRVGGRPIVS